MTGLVSATVATLADVGWHAPTPYCLKAPDGARFDWNLSALPNGGEGITTKRILNDILEHMGEGLNKDMWTAASKCPRSSGLELGVDWSAYKFLTRIWTNDGNMKGMLQCVVANSFISPACRWQMYCESRKAGTVEELVDETADFSCPFGCGATKHLVTHRHLFWDCSKLPTLGIREVDASENLRRRATSGIDGGQQGFWLRGCTPKTWTHDLEDEPGLMHRVHGRADIETLDHYMLFTDGSGGKHSGDPRRRRATFGGVVMTALFDGAATKANLQDLTEPGYTHKAGQCCWFIFPSSAPADVANKGLALAQQFVGSTGRPVGIIAHWILYGRLEGRKQTVPRAELRAIQCSLQELPSAKWQVFTDHENHVKNALAGRTKCLGSGLGELWQQTWESIDRHEGVDFSHVYSHRDNSLARDLAAGRCPLHFLGNSLADIAASLDQEEARMTWATTETISTVDGLSLKVMKRLTAIALHIAEQKRVARPKKLAKQSKPDIAALKEASQHNLQREGRDYRCTVCTQLLTRCQLRKGEMDWCVPVDAYFLDPQGRPGPPPPDSPASQELARRLDFHCTHQISRFPQGICCWRCGCWSSSSRAVGLRKPCTGHPTPSGKLALERICLGRPARWMPVDEADADRNRCERAQTVRRAEELQQLEALRRSLLTPAEPVPKRHRYRYKQPSRSLVVHHDNPVAEIPATTSDAAMEVVAAPVEEIFLDNALGLDDMELLTIGELMDAQAVGFVEDEEHSDPAWGVQKVSNSRDF